MDLISRQAAIDAADRADYPGFAVEVVKAVTDEVIKELKKLTSEDAIKVVRCKDCKHSTEWYRDKRRCFLWCEDGIDVFEDGYCSYWEKKNG